MTDEITEIIESNERMREALKECYDWFRNEGSDVTYGLFHGGDPRNFSPDPDCSTEDERAAWEADCKAWNEAEKQGASMKPLPGCCTFSKDMILTRNGYGLGVNACENEEADRMAELCLGALGGKP